MPSHPLGASSSPSAPTSPQPPSNDTTGPISHTDLAAFDQHDSKPSADDRASDKDATVAEEHASRKREREASLEPSAHPSPSAVAATESLPLKKNRVQNEVGSTVASSSRPEDVDEEAETAEDAHDDARKSAPETERVGQIRQKVQDLTWKEGKDVDPTDEPAPASDAEKSTRGTTKPTPTSPTEAKAEGKRNTGDNTAPVRAQPTFSAFSAKASPFSSVPTSSGSSSASGKANFAGAASPFKAFVNASASPSSAGGMKPSSLGSSIGGHQEASGTSAPPSSTSGTSIPTGPKLGFGAFAGASPLVNKTPIGSSAKEASPNGGLVAATATADAGKSFSEQLLNGAPSSSAKPEDRPALDAAKLEVITGEEDEQSVHSIRAKLYTMAEDQSWKERGTGTIRVNVPKARDGKHTARLVMRADGILRLILNVSLFLGMKCELQEKFVRIVAFEDGNLVHFAIKMSNSNNAVAFMDAVQKQISKLAS